MAASAVISKLFNPKSMLGSSNPSAVPLAPHLAAALGLFSSGWMV